MKGATLAIVAAVLVAVLSPAPAAAAPLPIGECTTSSGAVVAVDFGHWGGPVLRSCGSTPTTGLQLLNQGGWKTSGTQHDGPGFICRIGYSGYQGGRQYPTPADEACVLTPPATAYWSYWHADPGQTGWTYSQLGAASYHPKPGGVDLWTFGATDLDGSQGRPTISPDSVRALNSAPVGTPASGGSQTARPTPVRSSASAEPPATPSAMASPTAGPMTVPSGQSIVDALPTAAAAGTGAGSPTPVLIALGLLVVLGGVTALAVRLRRRRAG